MNYTLNQLHVFAKVVEHKSVTKASEELFTTQPAVSIQLKNFQDQFELPLIEVVGRKLFVTDFGQEIYQIAVEILEGVNAIKVKTHSYKGEIAGKLKISVVSTGKYVMPYFLTEFINAHPGVDLLMNVTNKSQVISSLQKNEVDFALVSVLPQQLKVNQIQLLQNDLYLFNHNKKNETNKAKLNQKDLEKIPLIFREEGSATRFVMENYFKKRERAGKSIELMSNEAVKQAVIAGLGYSIMPIIGLKNEIKNGDITKVAAPGLPISTKWRLIWLKEKKLSLVGEAYTKYLEANKDKIAVECFDWMNKI